MLPSRNLDINNPNFRIMDRIHLFEFEDQDWFPGFMRNYGTDFLQFLANKTKMFIPIIPKIEKGLESIQSNQIIDLASGGGGGLLSLNAELVKTRPDLKLILTDLFPNLNAFKYTQSQASAIGFSTEKVDARDVPADLKGLRTIFLGFHHFRPEDAVLILQNAVKSHQPILIVEGQDRSLPSLLAMFFSPLTVLFTTPFIRPFSIGRIVFTYLISIVPLFVWWDGLVSSFRTYSEKEMKSLISRVEQKDEFEWEVGRIKSGPGFLLFLTGRPKA